MFNNVKQRTFTRRQGYKIYPVGQVFEVYWLEEYITTEPRRDIAEFAIDNDIYRDPDFNTSGYQYVIDNEQAKAIWLANWKKKMAQERDLVKAADELGYQEYLESLEPPDSPPMEE